MPLTATGPAGIELDATVCDETLWASVHRQRPRVVLSCRVCGGPMHAKVSSVGSRFFAHDGLAQTCPSLGETPEHRSLKRMVASSLRDLGYRAELEATPSDGDHGGWRADVLASSNHGTRVAFEVQLAGMTIDEGARRTELYRRDGIQCVWITPRNPRWFTALPACRVSDESGRLDVLRGLGRLTREGAGGWEPADAVPFERLADALMRGHVTTVQQAWLHETIDANVVFSEDVVLLVTTSEAADLDARRAEQRRRQETHAKNLADLYERQQRTLQVAIDHATGAALDEILIGVPPTLWNGALPVDRRIARGSDATGGGAAIWSGDASGGRHLWAVICPVVTKATPSLGSSWRRRGVRVYAETDREAGRIAQALGWRAHEVVVGLPKV